jgi:hypothetical protein
MKVVELKRNEELVEIAKELLRDCESGEIVGLTIIAEQKDGMYQTRIRSPRSNLQMAGALLQAAIDRLGFKAE